MSKRNALSAFGEHVRILRLRARLTQEALAARAGLSRHYISDVEAGKRNPSLEVILQLAKGLNVSLPEIVSFQSGSEQKK